MAKKEKKVVLDENQKEIKILFTSNEMLINSIKDCINREKTDSLNLILKAIKENNQQILSIDNTLESQIKEQNNYINEIMNDRDDIDDKSSSLDSTFDFNKNVETVTDDNLYLSNIDDTDLQYDLIPLPSNGECYATKNAKIAVAYLTAESENLITSPHLYRDDMIIDALLKYHVLSKNININELTDGDVDAIMLWLRATGYGSDYPVIVKDPQTKEDFETIIDLSKVKYKEFKLKGDENGYFTYILPYSKVEIKFKYLTYLEEKQLRKLNQMDDNDSRASMISYYCNNLIDSLKLENNITDDERIKLNDALTVVKKWGEKNNKSITVNHLITNRLEKSIVSINGETDKQKISEMIKRMPARDSLMLRRYIEENKPGVDWNVEIEKPQSLGGGSMTIFLDWGADAFLNIE